MKERLIGGQFLLHYLKHIKLTRTNNFDNCLIKIVASVLNHHFWYQKIVSDNRTDSGI